MRLPAAKPTTWLLALGIVALQLLSALPLQGALHADEFFQYLEQPFRVLHGYGVAVWEFERGTRNWLLPGVILGMLRGCEAVGVVDPLQQLLIVRLVEKLLFLLGLWSLVRACDVLGGRRAAVLCALAVGLMPALMLATCHPLSEPFAMSLGMAATLPAARLASRPRLRDAFWSGLLLGLATVLRLQVAILIPMFAAFVGVQQGPRLRSPALLAGAAVALVAGGLLDLWTYGGFAHSTLANLSAHFEDDGALQRQMGTQPVTFYATEALRTLGPLAPLLPAAALWTFWRRGADLFALPALALIAVHLAMPHQELRFLLPALPLLLAAACLWVDLSWHKRWLVAGAAALWLASAPLSWQALSAPAGAIEAAHWVGARADLRDWCTVGTSRFEFGGYFFLRRNVPAHHFASLTGVAAARAKDPAQCSYVTTFGLDGSMAPAGGFSRVAVFGAAEVLAARSALPAR